jgi:hypothetical protein
MKNMNDRETSRRAFCGNILAGGIGLALAACSKQKPVEIPPEAKNYIFKYPENADEVFDFYMVFDDKGFNAGSAIERLKITGTPEKSPLLRGSRATYPAQNDLIKYVQLDIYDDGYLAELHLIYSRPIKVSFRRLKERFYTPSAPMPPGSVGSFSIYAANIEPPMRIEGTPSNGRQDYSFKSPSLGRVAVSARFDSSDTSDDGIHDVWEVGFIK